MKKKQRMAWRQARAIALLPGAVTVLVPVLVLIGTGTNVGWGLGGAVVVLPVLLGVALIAAGFALWSWTVRLFARVGEGTLAPSGSTQEGVRAMKVATSASASTHLIKKGA